MICGCSVTFTALGAKAPLEMVQGKTEEWLVPIPWLSETK
jgi:hypothetical protein